MAQTAVEYLIHELFKPYSSTEVENVTEIVERAKELEKQQIIEANINGSTVTSKGWGCKISQSRIKEIAERYYINLKMEI